MRGECHEFPTPHPFIDTLPGIYQDDDLTRRLLGTFDDVYNPVFAALDNLWAYFDPMLTPEDFLPWLAGWQGLLLDEGLPIERRRRLVASLGESYDTRGTIHGIELIAEAYTNETFEVNDSGGTVWSSTPGAEAPGTGDARVTVALATDDAERERLELVIRGAIPGHVQLARVGHGK